jgi:hypothetical protein
MTKNMPAVALVIGGLLILLGLGGFILGGATDSVRSALIPAYAGLPIAICGGISFLGPKARMIAMHVAVLVGLLGVLASLGGIFARVVPGNASGLAVVSLLGMLILCATFTALAVRSFVDARRARRADLDLAKPGL